MKKIIISGDKNTEISKSVLKLLEGYGRSLLISKNSLSDYSDDNTEFLICSFCDITDIDAENSVIIFLSPCENAKSDRLFNKKNSAVFYGERSSYGFDCEILTGHTSNCDLMVSSVDERTVYVSINSPFKQSGGTYFCPCEIKINVTTNTILNIKSILFTLSVLIYFGLINENELEINL